MSDEAIKKPGLPSLAELQKKFEEGYRRSDRTTSAEEDRARKTEQLIQLLEHILEQ